VEKKEGKFFPTPVGTSVNDFLITNFPDVFDYKFTAEMEDDLDKIANGSAEWVRTIRAFWGPFGKKLTSVGEKSKRVKIEVEKVGRACPECKKGELVIRIGRFGKFISCSRFPDCKHTEKYLEKAGMKCPECKKGDVVIKTTKRKKRFFGCSRYPECKWASWRKPQG
jgi:DNA topoisomerase-1